MGTVAEKRRGFRRRSTSTTGEELVVTASTIPDPAPPGAPPERPLGDAPETSQPDESSITTVREMTQGAINLQFSISERVDTKIRTYAGFAATAFTVAQAVVLKEDVHSKLGAISSDAVPILAIAAAVALLVSLVLAVVALRTRPEFDLDQAKLRDLLTRGYRGDQKAGSDGVNLLIGQLSRRQSRNEERTADLNFVILASVTSVVLAFAEIAVAVLSVA